MKKVIIIILSVIVFLTLMLAFWTNLYPEMAYMKTPSGRRRCESLYVTMEDGIRIGIEIWLPSELDEKARVPALIQATRYSRTSISGVHKLPILMKLQLRLGLFPQWIVPHYQLDQEADLFNQSGYAVVLMDMRGSGSSFGTRPIEWAPEEIHDMGEIIDWIIVQSWSNGKVGSWGTSYPGNTAELITSLNHPALKAVAPESNDFDPLFGVGMPGGLKTENFIRQWSDYNQSIDEDISNARPVDDDKSGEILKMAYKSHDSQNIYNALMAINYRDDMWGNSGMTMEEVSPYGLKEKIEASKVPMFIRAGWLDAMVADGAISRYMTFSNPQEVIIGPWGHGRGLSSDPLLGKKPMPSVNREENRTYYRDFFAAKAEQMIPMIAFFDKYLKTEEVTEPIESSFTYYTMGANTWQTTDIWPPENVSDRIYYFSESNGLSAGKPEKDEGDDFYKVVFSATTGGNNRWMTQMGHSIDYTADRSLEDKKLLVYTGDPLNEDIIITGNPVVTLFVESSQGDCAFHVYLEDVAPDGRVTYLTEGVLRAIHRPVSPEEAPYVHPGIPYSYCRDDARPLDMDRVEKVPFNLNALSVRIEKGHSIRIAIGGSDVSVFTPDPQSEGLQWRIMGNSEFPASIQLPVSSH